MKIVITLALERACCSLFVLSLKELCTVSSSDLVRTFLVTRLGTSPESTSSSESDPYILDSNDLEETGTCSRRGSHGSDTESDSVTAEQKTPSICLRLTAVSASHCPEVRSERALASRDTTSELLEFWGSF